MLDRFAREGMSSATLGDLIPQLAARLDSDTRQLDARVVVAYVLGRDRTWIAAHPEARLSDDELRAIEHAAQQLEQGRPLPYVIGHWEFYGLDFFVSPDVLIPRPETELLVASAIGWLKEHPDRRIIGDVGTGSGAIGVSLAHHVPDLHVWATDISKHALTVAQRNAERLGVQHRVTFVECDLLDAELPRLDLLCANLPYIPTATLKGLDVYRREPQLALDGGPDGLQIIRRLLQQAVKLMSPGGMLLLEIESSAGEFAAEAAQSAFPFAAIGVRADLAGRDRLLEIRL